MKPLQYRWPYLRQPDTSDSDANGIGANAIRHTPAKNENQNDMPAEIDYRTLYLQTLDKAAYALNNVASSIAHLTTGNLAHDGIGARINAQQWAKTFAEMRERDEQQHAAQAQRNQPEPKPEPDATDEPHDRRPTLISHTDVEARLDRAMQRMKEWDT
jgi:hypothetical protein